MGNCNNIKELQEDKLLNWVIDGLRRTVLHYGLWFNETRYQLGMEKAMEVENKVGVKSMAVQMKRLGNVLGFEVDASGVPAAIKSLPRKKLIELLDGVSINWLANDGIWFQGVENAEDIFTAKRCNDTCWSKFSPFEAFRIKKIFDLPGSGGLPSLKKALSCRLYSRINRQSFEEPDSNTLIFKMVECRVQTARKRKGLEDYPCKSGGLVEYTSFAKAIDKRIATECIGCPPDKHPNDWVCAWKFTTKK